MGMGWYVAQPLAETRTKRAHRFSKQTVVLRKRLLETDISDFISYFFDCSFDYFQKNKQLESQIVSASVRIFCK